MATIRVVMCERVNGKCINNHTTGMHGARGSPCFNLEYKDWRQVISVVDKFVNLAKKVKKMKTLHALNLKVSNPYHLKH